MSSLSSYSTANPSVFTVSQLNGRVKQLLEVSLNRIQLQGELSSWSRPSSGHWYFTLKDDKAQVRCAMFRSKAAQVLAPLKEGDLVEVTANVSLYEARGDYQLIVERMKPAGEGALLLAFEQLKRRLLAEGLFDDALKKPLPANIQRVGVVTSPTGAALHDILSVLKRRNPAIEVTVFPAQVQGEQAPAQIVAAIEQANAWSGLDVLIVGRGGGSLEDLWSFNDERVARAIVRSHLPVVSAVGHEVDTTISDFVADVRAPTPSAAAELVSTDQRQRLDGVLQLNQRLLAAWQAQLGRFQVRCQHARLRLPEPKAQVLRARQRLESLELRLTYAIKQRQMHLGQGVDALEQRLQACHPNTQLQGRMHRVEQLTAKLHSHWALKRQHAEQRLASATHVLDSISPLKVLSRGYALAQTQDGEVIRHATDVAVGDVVDVRVHQGQMRCVVKKTEDSV